MPGSFDSLAEWERALTGDPLGSDPWNLGSIESEPPDGEPAETETVLCGRCCIRRCRPGVYSAGGYSVCPTCYAAADECAECDSREFMLFETASSGDVCGECITNNGMQMCPQCNRYTTRRILIDGGSRVCRGCLSADYRLCLNYGCETYVYRWDSGYCSACQPESDWSEDEDEDESGCGCYQCRRSDNHNRLIHNYSFKPSPEFHGEGRTFMGFELEITTSCTDESARTAVNRLGGLGYLKEDGSVRGFELVTHPMTHEYARESFPWDLLPALADEGCDGYDNGLHVHVNRDGFDGAAHTFRWLKFIYRNRGAIQRVARRSNSGWGDFDPESRKHVKHYVKKGAAQHYQRNGYYEVPDAPRDPWGNRQGHCPPRYAAVNVQNEHTFEVRVFRSTLNRTELMAALDLVAGSVEYTRQLTVSDIAQRNGWEWSAFMKWINERPEYAALAEFERTHA